MPNLDVEVTRERSRRHRRDATRKVQDIAPLPEPIDIAARDACKFDPKLFAERYFPESIFLEWSQDQIAALELAKSAVLEGGKFALAMPRGSGKTTLCIIVVLWAILFHHKQFAVLIGANETASLGLIEDIKKTMSGNELLHADFPLETLPFALLEDEARQAKGQRYNDEKTGIKWEEKRIVFARIPGSLCSESVICVKSIEESGIRGTKYKLLDGQTIIRPDLAVVDDPQDPKSAKSPLQCRKRRNIIKKDILRMCGPKSALSCLIPCTVIEKDDLADQLLDRTKEPEFRGKKFKALYAFPTNMKLWDEYYSMRCLELRERGTTSESTEFYRLRIAEMDEGAEVAWPQRFLADKGEITGVQHCLHVYYEDPAGFAAEYQQEPLGDEDNDARQIEEKDVEAKIIRGIARGSVPAWATKLTGFIDVQKRALFYMVCAWMPDFTGHIVTYGAFPDQKRSWFINRDLPYPLDQDADYANLGMEGQIYKAAETLQALLLDREWQREGDLTVLRIEKLFMDAKWGESTDVVYEACRRSKWPTIVAPSQGRGIGAKDTPIELQKAKTAEELGHHWKKTVGRTNRVIPYYEIDTNWWKTFIANRIFTGVGDTGSLTIPGGMDGRDDNRLLVSHLTSESRTRMTKESTGRQVDEWKAKPSNPDNHWFDCLVGCAVAASVQNCTLPNSGGKVGITRKRQDPPPRRAG